jgi:hypothetical protein
MQGGVAVVDGALIVGGEDVEVEVDGVVVDVGVDEAFEAFWRGGCKIICL